MKENKWPAPMGGMCSCTRGGGRGATNVSADMLLSDRTCDKCCRSNLLVLLYEGGKGGWGGVVKSCSPGRCKALGCEDQQGIKEGRGRTFGGGGSNFSDVRLAMFSMTIAGPFPREGRFKTQSESKSF